MVLSSFFESPNDGIGAPIQTIEGGFESCDRFHPWVRNRASVVEQRIKIARDDYPRVGDAEPPGDETCLGRVHHNDKICGPREIGRQSLRAEAVEIDSPSATCDERLRRHTAIRTDETRRFHFDVWQGTLQHCLQVRAAADIPMTDYEYALRHRRRRQAFERA
jgi:hypothetical protein